MAVLVVALIAAFCVVALGLVALVRIRPPAATPAPAPPAVLVERRAVVMLDVEHADSTSPPVQRLVRETGDRIFASLPDSEEVEVRARDGSVLGRSTRVVPALRTISLPEFLHEPHLPRHPGPDITEHLSEDEPFVPPLREGPIEVALPPTGATRPRRAIAERFDLPAAARAALREPDDAVDVIRAILEAGGLAVAVDDDLLRVNELAIVVVRHIDGGTCEALNHAYLRIVASGADRGLVVALGHVDLADIRRREMLAPQILHTGFAGVQRMADAVALGADPLRFTVAPALAAPRAATP